MSYHKQVTALIQSLMTKGGDNYDNLVFASQMSTSTVRQWIKAWRESGLVHVSGWDNDSRGYPTIQRFAWNPGAEDVPCPAMTSTQRVLKWKARQKGAAS